MNPFFFGSSARRLFGVYAPAQGGGGAARALLVCHPFGQEYLRSHRSTRHLATLLARAGFHVLRFDYFGTGDSAGDMSDGDLAGWQGDVETAMDELKDTSGAARVALVGLRLGATLAAGVAAKRRDEIDALVLWDPVVSGKAYAGELWRQTEPPPGRAEPPAGSTYHVSGFPVTDRLSRQLRTLELAALAPSLPARTLVIVSEEASGAEVLRSAALPVERIPAPLAWIEERSTGVGAIPVQVLQRIVEWTTSRP